MNPVAEAVQEGCLAFYENSGKRELKMTISAKFCRVSCRFLPPPSQNKSQVCSATSPRVPLWTATSHTHTHTLASQCTHTQIGKSTHTQTGESTHTPPPTDWQVNTHLHSGKSTHTHGKSTHTHRMASQHTHTPLWKCPEENGWPHFCKGGLSTDQQLLAVNVSDFQF